MAWVLVPHGLPETGLTAGGQGALLAFSLPFCSLLLLSLPFFSRLFRASLVLLSLVLFSFPFRSLWEPSLPFFSLPFFSLPFFSHFADCLPPNTTLALISSEFPRQIVYPVHSPL